MSSFLATFKEVNQRGSEVKSGNPKSSRPSSVAPGGASQRSGRVGFYMTSCRRLTGPTQKPPSPIERDHLLTQPAGPHIPPSSPLLLIISQRSSSPLPALHTPGHAHDLAHNVCLPPWTISSAPPPYLWCTPNHPSKPCAKVASSGTSLLTPPLLCPPSFHLTHCHPCSPWPLFAPHPHDEQYERLFICLL